VTVDGIRIYGSPWQPFFCNWAFNLRTSKELKEKWDLIPEGIDILVTHGPPYGYGDKLAENGSSPGENVGCKELLKAVERVKPKIHAFGHVHEGFGVYTLNNTILINASICDEYYRVINKPTEVSLHQTT
jgi:Icc-related predicted phosphoesterase